MLRKKSPLIIWVLTLLFLLSSIGIAGAAPAGQAQPTGVTPFTDVSNTDKNALYINYMAERGLITGFPDGTYHPGEGLTRAQAAVLLCKIRELNPTDKDSTFSDVAGSHWAAGYITAAAQAGYITGFPDGTYRPQATLTRAQGINLFLQLATEKDSSEELPALQDLDKNHWAANSLAIALAAGMIEAEGNSIKPEQPFARGDLARALSILLTKDPGLNQQELVGQLKVKNGTVELKKAGGEKAQTINATSIVRKGDTIITGKDGEAEINYPDGSGILLKPNSELIIKTSIGRAYIVKGGKPGTAVEDLQVELTNGKLFGALASKYTGKQKTAEEAKKTAAHNQYSQIASRDKNFDLMAAKTSEQPWYKTAEQKKAKVKVDMPWGVAAVRGAFWGDTVSNTRCSMSLLEGDGELSGGALTRPLLRVQSCFISIEGGTPSPPTSMSPSEAREWSLLRDWVEERAHEIINNQSAEGLDEKSATLTELLDILNNALEQLKQIPASAPSGGSSRGGGGGGSGPVITQAAIPTANPVPGTYNAAVNVNLSCATNGANIYYTTDDSDPKTGSTRVIYSTPINIAETSTIKAYTTKSGMNDSDVVTVTYTINPLQVAVPTANPVPGTYNAAVNVNLNCATNGATIYYTTDGSDPNGNNNNSRTEYSEPICIEKTTTIKAYATRNGMADSQVVSFTYTITVSTPMPEGSKAHPHLANNQDDSSRYLMVYEKYDGNNSIICGQLRPTDDSSQGPEFAISGPGINREPAIVFAPYIKNYLVVWSDQGDNPAIKGQLVTPSGDLVGESFTVYADENNKPQLKPSMGVYYRGFLIVWQEEDSSSDSNIMGRSIDFDVNNTPRMEEPFWLSQAAGSHYDPALACHDFNTDQCLIVFNDGNNLKGILIGENYISDPFSIASGNGMQGAGTVVSFSFFDFTTGYYNGFLVAWQDQREGNFNIMARLVSTDYGKIVLGDELTIADSSNQETCPSLVSACEDRDCYYYLIAWQDKSLDNDIKARMLYPSDCTPASSVKTIASGTGEQLRPAMTSAGNKIIIAYEDQGTSPYTIGRYLLDESPPPKPEWIIIKNNATGPDEVTVQYEPRVIPVGAVVTVYDDNKVLLGSGIAQYSQSDGYFPPHITIENGFAPGLRGIYVTTTFAGHKESESTYVALPMPVMNKGTDYSVDTIDCGYGKIAYKVTAAQKAAMETATGKTIAAIKAYTTTDIETTFEDLTEAEATGGVEIPITDDNNDYVSVEKAPGNYGYAIAAYDETGQVVAYYVSTGWVTVY